MTKRAKKTPATAKKKAVADEGVKRSPGAEKPMILIVDDAADNRDIYNDYLTFTGYRVAEATNGEEAVELAKKLMPDIILMDLSLPGMDGWEATRRIKSDERTRKIPIVALTGHALEGHEMGARAAGCDGFLAKPCLPEVLEAELRRMLEGTTKPRSRGARSKT